MEDELQINLVTLLHYIKKMEKHCTPNVDGCYISQLIFYKE